MAEQILNNIGNFLQESCLSYCLTHTVEQVSYINISPHDVENRFLCIQCYQSEFLNEEEKSYIISLRLFLQKQQEMPHFQLVSEEVREQVSQTLSTKGKVNLRQKIQDFNAQLVEMITEELNKIFKVEDEKTQLINEKLQSLSQKFTDINNASEIYSIFQENKQNFQELSTKFDNYIKLSYLKANQLKEGNEEYEDLFDEFSLDKADLIKEKILSKVKQIHYYIPKQNKTINSLVDKSIFEEEPIFIDDSSLTLKSKSFLKLLYKIPTINSSVINQIEKQLMLNPIFEDIDFEIDEESQSEKKVNEPQAQNDDQKIDNNNPKIEVQISENNEDSNQNQNPTNQFSRFDAKQMNIQENISPIQVSQQSRGKTYQKKQNSDNQKDITEQELTQFISNALNDEISYNEIASQHKKNYSRYTEFPINQSQQLFSNRQNQSQNFANIFQSTPASYFTFQSKQENNSQSSNMSQQNLQNNFSDNQSKIIQDQKNSDFRSNNITNGQISQSQPIQQLAFQYDQIGIQQNAVLQQSSDSKLNQIIQNMNDENTNNQQNQNQTSKYLNMQKHQSANYDNYFKSQRNNQLGSQNNDLNIQKVQSKSRDQSPSQQFQLPIQKAQEIDNNNQDIFTVKDGMDDNKESRGGSSAYTMKELDSGQVESINDEKQLQQLGLLQIDCERLNLQMKKSKLGSSEKVAISHQPNNTIMIQSPTDSYAHYVISKNALETNKEYIFLFSINCSKNDSILIGITPKEYINEKVLHKFPYYKSFINTNLETFSQSCEKIDKGSSLRIVDDNCIHVVMRVCVQNQILVFYDYPKMENINSIKNPPDLKNLKQFYLTIGFTKSKESFNNPQSNPLRIQILDMRVTEPATLPDLVTINNNYNNSNINYRQQID